MKDFLIIIDSFKNSISSSDIGKFFASELKNSDYFPISDGGEGFLDVINQIVQTREVKFIIDDLNFHKRKVKVLIDYKDNAYLESSDIVGYKLIDSKNIFERSSFGIGEILIKLNDLNISNLYIGLGGSAVSEMGLGILNALGAKFFDKNRKTISHPLIKDVFKIDNIDLSSLQRINYKIHIVNDVTNPLLGKNGANFIFARQKGASEKDIEKLEESFKYLYKLLLPYINDNKDAIGDGSAGGLGFLFKHFFKASYHQGSDFILSLIDFDRLKDNYKYIITGEGTFDDQSLNGKIVGTILNRVDEDKVLIVCGINLSPRNKNIYPLIPNYVSDVKESMANPLKYLRKAIEDIKRDIS